MHCGVRLTVVVTNETVPSVHLLVCQYLARYLVSIIYYETVQIR
jgi:hypothetical protein